MARCTGDMSRTTGSEVVIIGAGVAGCATAYYLAKQGVQATIIERDSIGTHSSGFAFGALNPLGGAGIPDPMGALSLESYRLHQELATALPEESGIDTEFRLLTAIVAAYSEEEAHSLMACLPWQQAQEGFQVEWKNGADILALEPRLVHGVVGGVVTQQIGMLSSYRLTLALLQAAERMGAVMRHGRMRGLVFQGHRLKAVRLETEDVPCQAAVVAMGPWSADVSAWLGVDLPVTPLKGQILYLQVNGSPLPYLSWSHGYAVTKPDGLVWVGTTEEQAGFDETPSAPGKQAIMESAMQVLPYLADAQVVRHTACLRPVTADGLPILGKVPGKEGVIVATGTGRKGIHLSAIMGRIAAELVVNGRTGFDIAPLAPGRTISPAQVAANQLDPFPF